MTSPNKQPSFREQLWPWLVVLAVLLAVGSIRFRLLEMPLERDEGEYAYVGHLILQGVPPYELAYNMKLPGTYFAYAVGMAAFGQTIAGVHLTLITVNSLTIVGVFLLGRKLFGTGAGLVSCAAFGIFSLSPADFGLAAHANHFVILFAVPATLLLWNGFEDRRLRILFSSGLLYGLAFLMKQQGICFGLFGCLILGLQQLSKWKSITWKDTFTRSIVFGSGWVLPFGVTCLLLAQAGVFAKFWFWSFTYAHYYAVSFPFRYGEANLTRHLAATSPFSIGLWVLSITGLLLALFNRSIRKQAVFVVLFWIFSFLGTAIGFYFRQHYFILLLPAFAILIGQAIATLEQVLQGTTNKKFVRIAPLVLFAVLAGWNLMAQRDILLQKSPAEATRTIYPQNPFVESLVIGDYLRTHTPANASIAVLGSEPEIYFYAQRHSASGYIYTYALMESQPYAANMQHEMMKEIESNKPEYLVLVENKFSWLATPASDFTIVRWFFSYARESYEKVGYVNTDPSETNRFYIVMYQRKSPAVEAKTGDVSIQDGQLEDAIVDCQEALKVRPDFAGAHLDLGNALFQKGQANEAIVQYQKVLAINPDYVEAHDNLGTVLMSVGRVQEAIIQYEKTLELQPGNAAAHNNLGLAFSQEGKMDEAISHYRQALQIDHNYTQVYFNLGLALFKMGRTREAIASMQQALPLARAQHASSLADAIQAQLNLYQAASSSTPAATNSNPR